jgi:thiamine pyrophosphokinase
MHPEGHILLLLDGDEPPKELLHEYAASARLIVATDGAAKIAKKYDLKLDAIIGDMDSLDSDTKQHYEERQTSILSSADQESNDLEKALKFLISSGFNDKLVILGLHGKRTDHTLTNLSVLVRFRDQFKELQSIDAYHIHYLLSEKYPRLELQSKKNISVSLIPLPIATGIVTDGLFFPLTNVEMTFGQREGLSNIISSDTASVQIASGSLLISVATSNLK